MRDLEKLSYMVHLSSFHLIVLTTALCQSNSCRIISSLQPLVYTPPMFYTNPVHCNPKVEMIPDDCSTIFVSSVLISIKNAGESDVVRVLFDAWGIDGTTADEFTWKVLSGSPSNKILTDGGNKFRATFTIDNYSSFIANRVFDYSCLGVKELQVSNHHIPDIPFLVSEGLSPAEFTCLRNCTTSSRRWDCK